jgi:uncharacterized protein (DUF952 family)
VRIFHIIGAADWASAETSGTYAPESLASEGFVHFSFADQVAATANRYYRAEPQLQLIEVESTLVEAELIVEDLIGSGTEFPHVYGPVPLMAVVAVHALERDAAGDYQFTPDA